MTPGVQEQLIIVKPWRAINPESQRNLICGTWLPGLYYGNPFFRAMDEEEYFGLYRKIIHTLLERPGVSINAACLKEDQDVAIAYLVHEKSTLHWAWCRKEWRKQGIFTALLPTSKIEHVTHLTNIGKCIKEKSWKFNPFLA